MMLVIESITAHTMAAKGSSLFLIMGIVTFSSISKVVFSTSFTFPKRKPINQMALKQLFFSMLFQYVPLCLCHGQQPLVPASMGLNFPFMAVLSLYSPAITCCVSKVSQVILAGSRKQA